MSLRLGNSSKQAGSRLLRDRLYWETFHIVTFDNQTSLIVRPLPALLAIGLRPAVRGGTNLARE
jgi:hypothetical protein